MPALPVDRVTATPAITLSTTIPAPAGVVDRDMLPADPIEPLTVSVEALDMVVDDEDPLPEMLTPEAFESVMLIVPPVVAKDKTGLLNVILPMFPLVDENDAEPAVMEPVPVVVPDVVDSVSALATVKVVGRVTFPVPDAISERLVALIAAPGVTFPVPEAVNERLPALIAPLVVMFPELVRLRLVGDVETAKLTFPVLLIVTAPVDDTVKVGAAPGIDVFSDMSPEPDVKAIEVFALTLPVVELMPAALPLVNETVLPDRLNAPRAIEPAESETITAAADAVIELPTVMPLLLLAAKDRVAPPTTPVPLDRLTPVEAASAMNTLPLTVDMDTLLAEMLSGVPSAPILLAPVPVVDRTTFCDVSVPVV